MASKYEKRKRTLPYGGGDGPAEAREEAAAGTGQARAAASAAGRADALLAQALDYPAYESPYAARIDRALSGVLDRPAFSYDPESDPLWQAYRKQYAREGSRAAEDTLGRYAAMTGGAPSTAAVTAAQQAGDYYRAKTADAIPQLYKLAYSMYAADADRARADLNSLRALDNDAYGRWGDGYDRALRGWSAARSADNDAYSRSRDAVTDAQRERAFSYQAEQDALDRAYKERAYTDSRADEAWDRAYRTGEVGPTVYAYSADGGAPYEIGSARGRSFVASAAPGQLMTGGDGSVWVKNADGSVTVTKNGGAWTVPAPAAATTGRSGGSGGGTGRAKPDLTAAQVLSALRDGVRSQKVLDAYEYYYGEAFDGDSAGGAGESDYPVDQGSVLDLGYGPISAERLSELVASGEVEKYLDGGAWRFRRRAASAAPALPGFADRLTARFG